MSQAARKLRTRCHAPVGTFFIEFGDLLDLVPKLNAPLSG
jgi:hypothetical protein